MSIITVEIFEQDTHERCFVSKGLAMVNRSKISKIHGVEHVSNDASAVITIVVHPEADWLDIQAHIAVEIADTNGGVHPWEVRYVAGSNNWSFQEADRAKHFSFKYWLRLAFAPLRKEWWHSPSAPRRAVEHHD